MFSRRFRNWLPWAPLFCVIILVFDTTGTYAAGQDRESQTSRRTSSPTELRMRARLSRTRPQGSRSVSSSPTVPSSQPPTERSISPAERRLRKNLAAQRVRSNDPTPKLEATVHSAVPVADLNLATSDPQSGAAIVLQVPDQATDSPDPSLEPDLDIPAPNSLDSEAEQPTEHANSVTIEFFEQLAIQNHPTLNATISRLMSVRHEATQAGLHPNPQLGLFADEMGNANDPGIWGAYLQSKIVRGNKLPLNQSVKNRQASVLENEFEAQIIRVRTDVRVAFYRLVIAQEKLQLAAQLLESQQNAVSQSEKLFEGGETPRTDLLQIELQAQKAFVLRSQAEVAVESAWRELATIVGQPDLALRQVSGSIESIANPGSYENCLAQILINSPELLAAKSEVERARCVVQQQLAQGIPDYQTQVAVGRDANTNHFFAGVQLQVPMQIYDRNQGNIAAAKSKLVAAQCDVETIELRLSKRLAAEYRRYQTSAVNAEILKSRLLPNAQQTLDLLSTGYPEEVSFVRLVTAQQTVIDITIDYLSALDQLWSSRLKIEGLLLDNSLEQD